MMQIYLKTRLSLIQWNFPNSYSVWIIFVETKKSVQFYTSYSVVGSRVGKVETNPRRLITFLCHIQVKFSGLILF
jgi:hypothetical protein